MGFTSPKARIDIEERKPGILKYGCLLCGRSRSVEQSVAEIEARAAATGKWRVRRYKARTRQFPCETTSALSSASLLAIASQTRLSSMYTPANQPRGRGTRSPRYLMHTSGGNYRPGGRPLTEGLATRAIGALDNRVLRFIEAADRTAAHTPETEPEPEISSAPIRIHNLRVLGSFNWTQSGTPKILIPGTWALIAISPFIHSLRLLGSPPIWRDENMPFTLRLDTEVFADRAVFVDSGAGTDQATSLLAMLAAVDECTASAAPFDWNMADVITDRNSLRNLLRWVNQSPTRKVDEFRIDMHLAGERSLVLTRWKRDTHVQALPGSFGFSYEENQTTPAPGCEDSRDAGHVRIISYVCTHTLGGVFLAHSGSLAPLRRILAGSTSSSALRWMPVFLTQPLHPPRMPWIA